MVRFSIFGANPKSIFIAVVAILIIVSAGLFFITRNDNASIQNQLIEIKYPPMPTEINSNFQIQVNECLIPIAAVYGYTLRISSGYRSVEEQDAIYEQGRTVNGHIVTEAPGGKSIHNFGYAVDVVDRWYGFDINWDRITKMAQYCGLESGGEGDVAHFEHRSGLTTDQFRQGLRPVDLTLPCVVMHERAAVEQKLTLKDLQNCGAPKF